MDEFMVFSILFVFVLIILVLVYFLLKSLKKVEKQVKSSSFKCNDGHVVRSKGELIVDNYLYRHSIEHIYEKTIKIHGKPIKYDWYLPKYKIYIEYWGFFGKKYLERKKEKIKLYRKGKLKLLSIEDIMFKDINFNLEQELNKFIDLDKSDDVNKHCPNCGIELDNRF